MTNTKKLCYLFKSKQYVHFQSRVERVVEYWAVIQKCDTNVVATANEGDVSISRRGKTICRDRSD